jgi:hypothetical protein
MQEILRMKEEGTANKIQKLWLRETKPPEELYDLGKDPHEVNNLAMDPGMVDVKARLSAALDSWIAKTGDPLTLPETQLKAKLWPPDGIQPETRPVIFREDDGHLILESDTDGASIAYQSNGSIGGSHWDLYTGPIPVRNIDTIKALAVRIGYRESAPRQYALKEK